MKNAVRNFGETTKRIGRAVWSAASMRLGGAKIVYAIQEWVMTGLGSLMAKSLDAPYPLLRRSIDALYTISFFVRMSFPLLRLGS